MPDHALYLLATYRKETAPVYTLTVNSGSGSGTSQAGSILNIGAGPPPAGQIFDRWTGDTQEVVNADSPSTTLRMPANNVTVTAVYRIVDSTGDGIPDSWRAAFFGGDGATVDSQSAADADPDGDGMNNLQEFAAGTSPVNAASVLMLQDLQIAQDATRLSFVSGSRRCRLETARDLTAPVWETVLYNIYGDGAWKHMRFESGLASNGFYRLRTSNIN
jgi:hypothetical protein